MRIYAKVKEWIHYLDRWMTERAKTKLRIKLEKLHTDIGELDLETKDFKGFADPFLTRYKKLLKRAEKLYPEDDSFEELTYIAKDVTMEDVESIATDVLLVIKSNISVLLGMIEFEDYWEEYEKLKEENEELRKENKALSERAEAINKIHKTKS